MNAPISFEIIKRKPGTLARAGVLHTPHGDIETPAFIVVGTKGTVKSVKPDDLERFVENEVTLANTYHLYLQPGPDVIKEAGGLNRFAGWKTVRWLDCRSENSRWAQPFPRTGGTLERAAGSIVQKDDGR